VKKADKPIMSLTIWKENLKRNCDRIHNSSGPSQVIVVSGTEADQSYWRDRFNLTRPEMFRRDGSTRVLSIYEREPKGNFLGTLNAWQIFRAGSTDETDHARPNDVILTSMVFGKGTRLSPFTQTLGNCKPRFPTPYRFQAKDVYLSIGELSTRYSNRLIGQLKDGGFRGMVVKWGDEIVLPGSTWYLDQANYRDVDGFRFVWFTEPTSDLAREKDWVLVDADTDSMRFQLARQSVTSLLERAASKSRNARLGVNLGSLGISYDFLDIALDVFGKEVAEPVNKIDWDPYVWLALACEDEREWREEMEIETRTGNSGLAELETKHPEFFSKITRVKKRVEDRNGRRFTVKALDFGDVFWTDFGQHLALRQNLHILLEESDRGKLTRELFNLPHERDAKGNTIVNSKIHPEARIHDSLIVDSEIRASDSHINGGIVVGSTHYTAQMPQGGVSLFCTTRDLVFQGPNAIAFNSIAPSVSLSEGGRHATIMTRDGIYQLYSSEAITNYKGENYSGAILNNEISFAEANKRIDGIDQATLDELRKKAQAAVIEKFESD
jgi:hypothetical protein